MRRVKFDDSVYNIVGFGPNVTPFRFNVVVNKGDSTIDQVLDDAVDNKLITVLDDDGEVVGRYVGYTKLVAITTYDGNEVNIELDNVNLQAQIEELSSSVSDLEESQATQDLAIEDLAEAVSDLTPEED